MAQRVLKGPLAANWPVDEGPPLRSTGIDTREVVLVVDQWSHYPRRSGGPHGGPSLRRGPPEGTGSCGLEQFWRRGGEEEEEEEEEGSHAVDSTSTKRTKEETH